MRECLQVLLAAPSPWRLPAHVPCWPVQGWLASTASCTAVHIAGPCVRLHHTLGQVNAGRRSQVDNSWGEKGCLDTRQGQQASTESGLPGLQRAVSRICRQQVAVGVVCQANGVLLGYLHTQQVQANASGQRLPTCQRGGRYAAALQKGGQASCYGPPTCMRCSSLPLAMEKQYNTPSSPRQYAHSPRGDRVNARKSPPTFFPD